MRRRTLNSNDEGGNSKELTAGRRGGAGAGSYSNPGAGVEAVVVISAPAKIKKASTLPGLYAFFF